jgi:hypothetical protein
MAGPSSDVAIMGIQRPGSSHISTHHHVICQTPEQSDNSEDDDDDDDDDDDVNVEAPILDGFVCFLAYYHHQLPLIFPQQ